MSAFVSVKRVRTFSPVGNHATNANAAGRCRTCCRNSAYQCMTALHSRCRSRQRRTVSSRASASRNEGISSLSSPSSEPVFRCLSRISRNEIRKSAYVEDTSTLAKLKTQGERGSYRVPANFSRSSQLLIPFQQPGLRMMRKSYVRVISFRGGGSK